MRKTIAIDLGGTKALGAVFSPQGEILTSKNVYLRGASGEAAGNLVLGLIDELESAGPEGKVVAVGICVPGIAYQDSGCVWAPNIPGWDHYPLRERIRGKMGDGVHVRIESDRTCYILGETWKGAAKGSRNAIYMAVGTGIGAGIISEGRVLRGSGDIAGAIGWMGLECPFREDFVQTGCFESYASGNGIGQRLREAVLAAPEYSGVLSRLSRTMIPIRSPGRSWTRRSSCGAWPRRTWRACWTRKSSFSEVGSSALRRDSWTGSGRKLANGGSRS